MPKTNDATGATYAGYEGVVEHAGGFGSTRPGGLSEVHPEKNLDGTLIDGEHPDIDEDGVEERETADLRADSTEIRPADQAKREDDSEDDTGSDESKPEETEDSKGFAQTAPDPKTAVARGRGRSARK